MSKVEFSYFTLLIVAFLNDALSFRRVSLCNYIAFTFANKKNDFWPNFVNKS